MNLLDASLNRATLYGSPDWDAVWYANLGATWFRVPDQSGGWKHRQECRRPPPKLRKLGEDGQRKLKRRLQPIAEVTP